jgi:hypothetical protein
MTASVALPFVVFPDVDGDPLDDGYIYIGTAGLNAEANPVQAYWDSALSSPAAQPIRTINGYPSRSGSPARIFVSANDYSILVKNKNGSLVWSSLTSTDKISGDQIDSLAASKVKFTQSGGVEKTAADRFAYDKNLYDYGATGDGVASEDAAVALADTQAQAGELIEVTKGTYLFEGENINGIENFDFKKNAVFKNSIYSGTVQQDEFIAWLHQNHLEEEYISTTMQAITSGNIPAAPLFKGDKQQVMNVLAYWYNDFGIEAVRAAGGSLGWLGWYYWSWLFHGAAGDGYEAERHPLLGYYRGDEPNVLDWICYWLNQAGVSGVILQATNRDDLTTTWNVSTSRDYWIYKLMTATPNFKRLTYTLWAGAASSVNDAANHAVCEAIFDEVVSVYSQYKNFSFIEKNGKIYPIVFAFEGEYWRGAYDSYSGSTNTRVFLKAQAVKFQAEGWGGVCILARNSTAEFCGDQDLEGAGVIYFDAEYSAQGNYDPALNSGVNPAVDYEDLAIGMGTRDAGSSLAYRYTIPALTTSAKSHSAHPSTWNWPGSTPDLFELMCRNVFQRMVENDNPKIVTIYNVSEWAEGGPALQPNMRDGKGYLQALKNALESIASAPVRSFRNLYTRQANQFLSAPTVPIVPDEGAFSVPVTVSYAWTSTASPVIDDPNPYDGKRIRVRLDNASAHAGPVTMEDIGTRAGSGLRLTAATISLGKNDSVEFEYDATQGYWIQVGPVVNVL